MATEDPRNDAAQPHDEPTVIEPPAFLNGPSATTDVNDAAVAPSTPVAKESSTATPAGTSIEVDKKPAEPTSDDQETTSSETTKPKVTVTKAKNQSAKTTATFDRSRLMPYLAGLVVLALIFGWLGIGAFYRSQRSDLALTEANTGLESGQAVFDSIDQNSNKAMAGQFGDAVQRSIRLECSLKPVTQDDRATWVHTCTLVSVTAYQVSGQSKEQIETKLTRASRNQDALLGVSAPDPRATCPVLLRYVDGGQANSVRFVPGVQLNAAECAPNWAPSSNGDLTVRMVEQPRSLALDTKADFVVLTVSRQVSQTDVGCKPIDVGCPRPFLAPVVPQ